METEEDFTGIGEEQLSRAFHEFFWAGCRNIAGAIFLVGIVAWIAGETVPWWGWLLAFKMGVLDYSQWVQWQRNSLNEKRFSVSERAVEAVTTYTTNHLARQSGQQQEAILEPVQIN